MKKAKVLFDAERMKYEHTGLYHYCLQLGNALLDVEQSDIELAFYKNPCVGKIFGDQATYVNQYSLHKLLRPAWSDMDIYHANFQLSDYLPRKGQTKVVLTIHDLNFIPEGKSEQKVKKYLSKLQRNIDRADEIVAISNYVKADIEQYCQVEGKNIHVIYNGNNVGMEQLGMANSGSPLEKPYLFTIGAVNRKKNFKNLIYLLLGNEYDLVISGLLAEPGYVEEIKTLAAKVGVVDRVHITGPISEEEKYTYLKHAELFVFPSVAEGFGLPVVEAMAFGKRVLLSQATSLPEIGGDEAFYLDNTEEDYLTDYGRNKLENLLALPVRTDAIQKWASQFSWERAAGRYIDLYKKLTTT